MTLKAFAVLEKEENTGDIFFAEHNIVARKAGANEFADGEIEQVTCRRAQWADKYAGSKVPVHVRIENGWNYECSGCGVRIDADLYDDYVEYGEEENTSKALRYEGWKPTDIVEDGNQVYCQEECQITDKKERAAIKAQEMRHRKRLEKYVARRFPGVTLIDKDGYRTRAHTYCQRDRDGKIRLEQANIPFAYPGMKHGPGDLYFERRSYRPKGRHLSYNCAGGDIEAFTAFLKAAGIRSRQSAQMNKLAA